jgi:hypothetical protein
MDHIQPIGSERDVDPVLRVKRAREERERREREEHEREADDRAQPKPRPPASPAAEQPQGPVEGDDGHLHIDIKA